MHRKIGGPKGETDGERDLKMNQHFKKIIYKLLPYVKLPSYFRKMQTLRCFMAAKSVKIFLIPCDVKCCYTKFCLQPSQF
jgi:hypothetical protein